MNVASCVPVPGLVLLLSGCSLLFSPADSSTGVESDADVPRADADPGLELGRVTHIIGPEPTQFATFDEWKSARSGNLGNRQELLVSVTGTQPIGGIELTGDLGCQGVYKPQKQYGERMTIDLTSGIDCQVGERLSSSGEVEVAQVTRAGPRGIIETVQLRHRTYQAPIVIDGFVNTSATHYLVVEANPGTPHKGVAGMGVIIGNVSEPPVAPSHGVTVRVDYTQLRGFEITNWALGAVNSSSLEGVRVAANRVLLDRLLIHDDGTDRELTNTNSDGIFSEVSGIELTVRNSFIYNVARAGILFQGMSAGVLRVQSCTLHNCSAADAESNQYGCVAAETSTVTVEAINTLAFAQSAAQPAFVLSPGSTFAPASSNNASNDFSHPPLEGADVGYAVDLLQQAVGGAYDDLHLKPMVSAMAPYVGGKPLPDFAVDIDGDTRGATWSIGADQP